MKTLTIDKAALNFNEVLDEVESGLEEVVLLRNRKAVARLVPEPASQNALEVLGDLHHILDEQTAADLEDAVRTGRNLQNAALHELRNPWDS